MVTPLTTQTAQDVNVPIAGGAVLQGTLALPSRCLGLVLFAHGSGSSRFSHRNRQVAASLRERGIGTLLFDLLTIDEEAKDRASGQYRFDIALLSDRLSRVTAWVESDERLVPLPIGYFGASTGAAAALIASTSHESAVHAIVSRGGRADLAGPYLHRVRAPTLLVVGSRDDTVLDLNRQALHQLTSCEAKLAVIPAATHLFEEPGALEQVSELAGSWLVTHLTPKPSRSLTDTQTSSSP